MLLVYFTSRDIGAIAMSAALWSILNVIISPVFWQMTHLPFCCDMIGFTCLILVTWWTRKLGTTTLTGIIATIINLFLRPGALHFFGFTAASIFFDVASIIIGYRLLFGNNSTRSFVSLVALSVISGAIAGVIIGSFFMNPKFLATLGGLLFFVGLHSTGGLIGGILGFILVKAVESRKVIPFKQA